MPATYQALEAGERPPLTEKTVERLRDRDSLADVAELAARRLRPTHSLRRAIALLALSIAILTLPLVLVLLADGDRSTGNDSGPLMGGSGPAASALAGLAAVAAILVTGLVGFLSRRAEARRDEEERQARHWDDRYLSR